MRSGPNAIDLIPGAVRPLLEADLPMVLWWTGDPREHEPLFRDLADECSRLVLDLPDPGTDAGALRLGLDVDVCECSRDSAWYGLARWRELVAQFLTHRVIPAACTRSIRCTSRPYRPIRPVRPGWRFGWRPGSPVNWDGTARDSRANSTVALESRFLADVRRHGRQRGRRYRHTAPARWRAIPAPACGRRDHGTHTGGTGDVPPEPPGRRVIGGPCRGQGCRACFLPRVVESPELDPARRIAAALESSRLDPPFHKALPIALWLMQ